jgi:drug/metabolite transporter (DMT)-like permease
LLLAFVAAPPRIDDVTGGEALKAQVRLRASGVRLFVLATLAMAAFAANSMLCRGALTQTAIDPASFTLVRIAAGAAMLIVLTRLDRAGRGVTGSWQGAVALLAYAACFSFAYISLAAGTGALLLFGAVQVTMILRGLFARERLGLLQGLGLVLALGGLAALLAPGVTAPEPIGALLMVAAGIAWGAYSLIGRSSRSAPLGATAGNFLRAAPLALVPAIAMALTTRLSWDASGLAYAAASGALASGVGYAVWYAVLPALSAATAASIQLSVPVITALGGALLLGETITLRLTLASLAVLGGIALVVRAQPRRG